MEQLFFSCYTSELLLNSSDNLFAFYNTQGASALTPGDARAFKALLRTLPIESALTNGNGSSSPLNHSHSHSGGATSPSRHQQHYAGSFQATQNSVNRSTNATTGFF